MPAPDTLHPPACTGVSEAGDESRPVRSFGDAVLLCVDRRIVFVGGDVCQLYLALGVDRGALCNCWRSCRCGHCLHGSDVLGAFPRALALRVAGWLDGMLFCLDV